MLSYLHEFHAGNHADVLKHFVLTLVLDSLNKKQKPFTFFDTHSGAGKYNLNDEMYKELYENGGLAFHLKFMYPQTITNRRM